MGKKKGGGGGGGGGCYKRGRRRVEVKGDVKGVRRSCVSVRVPGVWLAQVFVWWQGGGGRKAGAMAVELRRSTRANINKDPVHDKAVVDQDTIEEEEVEEEVYSDEEEFGNENENEQGVALL